jgi:hypothetical protein
MHHGIKGQKWGIENGPPYPLNNHEKLSNQIFNIAKRKEPQITNDVSKAIISSGARMHGIEHKLKTKDSIDRKIQTDAKEKQISEYKAANDIKDAIRYTSIINDNNFVKSYNQVKKSLENDGYTEVRCRNYFDMYNKGKVKHKSVQCVYKDPDGYLFEIQFQTPASQKAKDKKVPLYERRRTPGLSLEEQKYLEDQMDKLAKEVPDPKNVFNIKSHG